MARSTPPDASDTIAVQVRRVRWRWNFHALQWTLYLLVALGAGTATVLLLLALRAGIALFAAAGASVVAAAAAGTVLVVRSGWRRWLGRARAALWIDRRAALEGRLATLVELERTPVARTAFFWPLLEAENAARLPAWAPERLLPDNIPAGALGAGLGASVALFLTLAFAPELLPSRPEIVYSDEPQRLAGIEGLGVDARRLLIAPTEYSGERGDSSPFASAGGDGEEAWGLAHLAGGLQERIRERLWGKEWTRTRDALARAERARSRRDRETGGGRSEDAGSAWELARTPNQRNAREGESGDAAPHDAARREHAGDGDEPAAGGTGEAGPGAGTATDPNLFGTTSEATASGEETFELAITARVRAGRMEPRRPSGEAPPPALDAHPALAAHQRQEAAMHRMAAPAAYEAIVREVFAHHPPSGDARP